MSIKENKNEKYVLRQTDDGHYSWYVFTVIQPYTSVLYFVPVEPELFKPQSIYSVLLMVI